MRDSAGALSTLFSLVVFPVVLPRPACSAQIQYHRCQQSDPEGECCDMRLVHIRNKAAPSEIIPEVSIRRTKLIENQLDLLVVYTVDFHL